MYTLLLAGSVPGPLLAGRLAGRYGHRPVLVGSYVAGAAALVLLVVAGSTIPLVWLAIGFVGAFVFEEASLLQGLLVEAAPAAIRDAANSTYFTLMFLVGAAWAGAPRRPRRGARRRGRLSGGLPADGCELPRGDRLRRRDPLRGPPDGTNRRLFGRIPASPRSSRADPRRPARHGGSAPHAPRPFARPPRRPCRRPLRVRRRVDARLDVRPDPHADGRPVERARRAAPLRRPPALPRPPRPAAGGGAVQLTITASGIAYDTDSLEVPADTPFQIVFTNNDAGIPHNVAIHKDSPTGAAGLDGRHLQRGGDPDLRRPGPPRGDLRLRLHRPPQHDRHPHGEVGRRRGGRRAPAAAGATIRP